MKYVVWSRGVEENPYGGTTWQRRSPPMMQHDAEAYIEVLRKKRGSKMLVFRVEKEGDVPKAELLHKLGRLAHRRYDTDAYPDAVQALLDFIDDPEIEDAFRRVPQPEDLDDEEEN